MGDYIIALVTVTNNGPDTATGVNITNPTPNGLTYLNTYYTNYGINWQNNDGTYNPTTGWTINTIAKGATYTLELVYQITNTGTITDTATKTTETQADPNTTNDQSTASITVPGVSTADINVTTQILDDSWNIITNPKVGDYIISLITVTNNGPDTATGVNISNPTPTGLTYLNTYYTNYGINWQNNDGTFNPTTGWTINTIAKGATNTLELVYQITSTGTITDTATKTTETQADPNTTNDQSTASITVPGVSAADIDVTTQILDDSWNIITTPKVGDYIISLITVTNNGPDTATGVNISNPTPNGLTYLNTYYTNYGINWLNNDGTFNPTTGWTINTIAKGATNTLELVYQITNTGTITDTATKTTETQADPNTTNDQSTASITVPGVSAADIGVTTQILDDSWNIITTPKVGDYIISLITVTNNGPDTATGVNITNPTPNGLTYLNTYYTNYGINWQNNDGTFNPTTGWTINTIAKGATYTLELVYQITNTGTITDTATKTTETTPDPNTTNDQSTTTISV